MNSLYVITAWINACISLLVSILVFLKNPRRNVNRRWALMGLGITVWSLFLGFMFNAQDSRTGLFFSRFLMSGAIIIPITFYHFVVSFLSIETEPTIRRFLKGGYLATFLLLLFNLTPFLVKGTSYKSIVSTFYPDAGPLFLVYIVYYFVLSGYAFYLLQSRSQKVKGQERNQINYISFASVIGFIGGATTFPLWYQMPLPPLGSHFVWIYALTITIAILRYRLMDISVVITRTGIFIAVYTIVLGIPFALALWLKNLLIAMLGVQWWMAPLLLMAVLATVGPFVYIYLDRKAEERLLREQKRYQRTLKQASVGMTRVRELRRLLDLITHIVTKTVRISYAAVYLYDRELDQYCLQVSRDRGREFLMRLPGDDPLVLWVTAEREPLIYEEVKRMMQEGINPVFERLEGSMRALEAAVIIPSFLEERLIGFIMLGDKISGQIYTPEDLNVFQILATQAALAIENAQFYEAAKHMQEQIAQAEKMATIGTMADGLSHQINNRFYALSLIASDSIDTIKMTDTNKCSPEVKEMLESVSKALERIQVNVMQGGEVVKGILKYTRKGEEGFEALSLDRIIDGTLDMVRYKIKLTDIDIIRNLPEDAPKIKGNQVQLQEAFFNLIDNAYDAIMEKKALLQEPDFRGRITISMTKALDHMVEIVIEDNGIGVKEQNNRKLFTPFFTTKTSSRKGTGLGLYVIKRIISEMHGGTIAVESAYQKGTRFILNLPVA